MINITGVGKRVCQAQDVYRFTDLSPPLPEEHLCAFFSAHLLHFPRKREKLHLIFRTKQFGSWDREYRESAAARMCIFQSGSDIPPLVRLSLRTLQYLVIPLLSLAILCIGVLHLGKVQIGSSCCDFPSFQAPGKKVPPRLDLQLS